MSDVEATAGRTLQEASAPQRMMPPPLKPGLQLTVAVELKVMPAIESLLLHAGLKVGLAFHGISCMRLLQFCCT